MTSRAFVVTALLAAAVIAVSGAAGDPGNGEQKKLDKIQHIVVIYEENHSFDNLYGGWEGVNGRADADPRAHDPGRPGRLALRLPAPERRQPDVAAATATARTPRPARRSRARSANAPFTIDKLHPDAATTCPPPGASPRGYGFTNGTGAPGRLHARPRAHASTRRSTSSTAASRTATPRAATPPG